MILYIYSRWLTGSITYYSTYKRFSNFFSRMIPVILFLGVVLSSTVIRAQEDDASQGKETAEQEESVEQKGLGGFFAESLQKMLREGNLFVPNGTTAQPVEPAEPGEPERFKLNFNNASIDKVLKFVSDMTKKVVLKSDDVSGQFTIINPNEVTQEEAMKFIDAAFMLKGFTFIEYDDMMICLPVSAAKERGVDVEFEPVSEEMGSRVITRMITLENVSPSEIKESLSSLVSENAVMIADDRTRSLIITDTASNIRRLETIINQLDKEDSLEGLAVQVFKLRYGDAREIARGLDDLVENIVFSKMTGGDVDDRRDKAQYNVEVIADRMTNSIIIAAPKEAMEDIADFIKKLDVSTTKDLEMKTFSLKNADAAEIVQSLQELAQSLRTNVYRPSVTADSRTNTVIVYAYPDDIKSIGNLIDKLDSGKSYEKVIRVFPLENADAIILSSMLQQLITEEGSSRNRYRYYWGRRDEQEDIKIMEDQRLNAIIVIAKPSDIPLVEDLIEQLDIPLPQSTEEPRVYPVEHVRATDLAAIINELFSEDQQRGRGFFFSPYQQEQGMTGLTGKVKVLADPTTNSIIVITGTPRAFDVVSGLIEKLDRLAPEFGTTQVFHLKNADSAYLAEQLNQLFEEDTSRGGGNRGFYWFMNRSQMQEQEISNLIGQVRIVSETRTNSLMVTTSSQYFDAIENLIEELDRDISQVLIEILIVEMIDVDDNQLGIDWPNNIPIQTQVNFEAPISDINLERAAVISNANFSTVLRFLSSNSKTNVIARPNILTRDNQGAYVEVVTEVPTVESVSITATGIVTPEAEFHDTGLKLSVTPHINDATTVTIDVDLENGQVLEELGLETQGLVIPAFTRRTVQTELTIHDNETAVLSGVLDSSLIESEEGIPGLMHIPIIGNIFKSKTKRKSKTELMAFITPYILADVHDRDEILQRHRRRIEMYSIFKNQMDELEVRIGKEK